MSVLRYREAVRAAMIEEMERDPLVYLIGEEVGHYQGAYKVTEGMLEKFGEKRVIDTPITESGFTGISIGAAMVVTTASTGWAVRLTMVIGAASISAPLLRIE